MPQIDVSCAEMKMKNDNEKTKHNTLTAKEFFSQFSKGSLLKIVTLADIIKGELEITKKRTNEEKETYRSELEGILDEELEHCDYENSDYVLRLNFGRISINLTPDEFEKLLQKVGSAFRFLDPITTQGHPSLRNDYYIGITSKKNFEFFCNQLNQFLASQREVKFDEKESLLILNGRKCEVTKYKNRYYFCKKMFEYPMGTEVSWDEIYEEMQGTKQTGNKTTEQARRTVYDTMLGLNDRVKNKYKIKDDLFSENNNMYKRNF